MGYRKRVLIACCAVVGLACCAFSWDVVAGQGKRKDAWEHLRRRVERNYSGFRGTAGIVVEDLSTGWEITINRGSMFPAASLVKIPIMAGCYMAVEEGSLSLTEEIRLDAQDKTAGSGVLKAQPSGSVYTVEKLIELMIAESDNTATNLLIDRVGAGRLNAFFHRQGLTATSLRRKMMDFSGRRRGVENYTSAGDIARLLERMYRGKFINAKVSRRCIDTLLRQKMKDRIPKKLPKDTPIAHKTGLERFVCHDAGVVFAPEGDFLICVLTKSRSKGGYRAMKDFIARIAVAVYDNYDQGGTLERSPARKGG